MKLGECLCDSLGGLRFLSLGLNVAPPGLLKRVGQGAVKVLLRGREDSTVLSLTNGMRTTTREQRKAGLSLRPGGNNC